MEEKGINNKIKNITLATDPLLYKIPSNFFSLRKDILILYNKEYYLYQNYY